MRMRRMTRRILQHTALTLVLVLGLAGLTSPTALAQMPAQSTSGDSGVTYYLALGDSLSQGYQNGHITDRGYVDALYATLKAKQPQLELKKLGCPGESTTTMIKGGICPYAEGSQLAAAKKFIKDHQGKIAKITITIGSNDVLRSSTDGTSCLGASGIIATCALAGISDVRKNLPTILKPLRDMTGRGAARAGMSYYDPYLAAWLQGPAGQALAKQSLTYINLLNGVLALGYLQNSFRVAPVAFAFQTNNFRTQNFPGLGEVPTNVGTICTYTLMCTAGDIHANDLGYLKIADVFARTFGHW